MSSWLAGCLGDWLELRNGGASQLDDAGGFPVFGANGVFGRSRKSNSQTPAAVIGRVGSYCGSVHYAPEASWVSENALIATPRNEEPARFWYFALTHLQLNDWRAGSGQPLLNQRILRSIPFTAPPIQHQRAIAEVLGALDDKIAANTALMETAQSLIESAFSLASRNGVRESPLLEELAIEFGEPFGGTEFSEPNIGRPLIRIRDLKTFTSQVWTTESRPREVVIHAGDVVVGMDAEFRATTWLGEPGLLNQRVLRARHPRLGNALVRELLRRPLSEVENEKSATTVIHLNKADLTRKTVTLPSEERLRNFELVAEPLYALTVALATENRTLASTRDALLPQLMSGKLRVRDAEKLATEAGA